MRGKSSDLDVDVLLVRERNSRQPVLLLDRRASSLPVFRRENPRRGREFRSGNFACHRAWSNSHLRIIPDPLAFPGIAASLHIQLIVFFAKPDGRRYSSTILAEGDEADVFLAPKLERDGHGHIVREQSRAYSLGTFVTAHVAREAPGMLQARDAQMDERALEAPQEGAGEGRN